MRTFEKVKLYNKLTGKQDTPSWLVSDICLCDYCGKQIEDPIYGWVTPQDSGDVTQEFFYAHKDYDPDFICSLYTNNPDFHFCPDGECEMMMMYNYSDKKENNFNNIRDMLYRARNNVLDKIINRGKDVNYKTWNTAELCGEEL